MLVAKFSAARFLLGFEFFNEFKDLGVVDTFGRSFGCNFVLSVV